MGSFILRAKNRTSDFVHRTWCRKEHFRGLQKSAISKVAAALGAHTVLIGEASYLPTSRYQPGQMLPLERAQSAGDVEMARRPFLPRHRSFPIALGEGGAPFLADASEASSRPRAMASTPWPGSDFKLEQMLPGSVYLWACGERGEGDGASPVSLPEELAAWAILIAQAMCYIGLWIVSGNRYGTSETELSESHEYSILAVAGAMFLVLSIAAADLWGGCALCVEGLGSGGFVWFTRRRIFGLFLLFNFATLVGASVRVLFYSSFEDVELVVGAAAVLFIADVDEKVMVVLKTVAKKWRLFWVLELIGLSFSLAVLAIKATGNDMSIAEPDKAEQFIEYYSDLYSDLTCVTGAYQCGIYGWYFVLFSNPIAVTVCSLVLTYAVAMPRSSLAGRLLSAHRGWIPYRTLVFLWLVVGHFRFGIPALRLMFGGGYAVLMAFVDNQELKTHLNSGIRRFSETVDHRPRRYLCLGGLAVVATRRFLFSRYDSVWDLFLGDFLGAVLHTAISGWLILGMVFAGNRPAADVFPMPRIMWLLLGWCLSEGFLGGLEMLSIAQFYVGHDIAHLVVALAVGTFLYGEKAGTYGLAFWVAASIIRDTVIAAEFTWMLSWSEGVLK